MSSGEAAAGENEARRGARRQARGLRRMDDILDAAAALFAEVGYDAATANAIAARLRMSPGSLYQFFPNKEAIARALEARYTGRLRAAYDATLSAGLAESPLSLLLDRLLDPLVSLKEDAGFLALYAGSSAPTRLDGPARELRAEAIGRLGAIVAARAPGMGQDQRERIGLVGGHMIQSLLPLTAGPDAAQNRRMVEEMKAALRRYLDPLVGSEPRA